MAIFLFLPIGAYCQAITQKTASCLAIGYFYFENALMHNGVRGVRANGKQAEYARLIPRRILRFTLWKADVATHAVLLSCKLLFSPFASRMEFIKAVWARNGWPAPTSLPATTHAEGLACWRYGFGHTSGNSQREGASA